MRNKLHISIVVIVGSSFMFSCQPSSGTLPDSVIAKVGNYELTLKMALDEIPEFILREDTIGAIENYRTNWIENKTIEREARQRRLHQTADYNKRISRFQNQLLVDLYKEFLLNEFMDDLKVTREEAQNYYQENKDRFVLEEKYVRFRHLTARTRVEADNARRDLLNGVDWDTVANRYSIEPDQQIKNSERYYPISMALADIRILNQYLNVIGITEISPIANRGGYFHFVQLLEEKPEGDHPDLDWLVDQIENWLFLEKSRRLVNTHIRNLYLQAEANNEIDKPNVATIESKIRNHFKKTE
ncbi:MAG: peptidyl-prolyl cis-trans isomerase [Balneolaceae bacterium]